MHFTCNIYKLIRNSAWSVAGYYPPT